MCLPAKLVDFNQPKHECFTSEKTRTFEAIRWALGRYKWYLVAHPTARKWVITPVINGISRVNPLVIGFRPIKTLPLRQPWRCDCALASRAGYVDYPLLIKDGNRKSPHLVR